MMIQKLKNKSGEKNDWKISYSFKILKEKSLRFKNKMSKLMGPLILVCMCVYIYFDRVLIHV